MIERHEVFSRKIDDCTAASLDIPSKHCYYRGGGKEDFQRPILLGRLFGSEEPVHLALTLNSRRVLPGRPLSLWLCPFCPLAPMGGKGELSDPRGFDRSESSRLPHCQYDRSPVRGGNGAKLPHFGGRP